jgi:hypothetical protein
MFRWLGQNSYRLPTIVFEGIAFGVVTSGQNAVLAARYIDSVPPAARATWIEQIGRSYGEQSPFESASWTEQFRGTSDHPIAVRAVAESLARRYPEDAIALLDGASLAPEDERQALQAAVNSWRGADPDGLRDWAKQVADPARLVAVASTIADAWARSDPQGATDWVLQLPASFERDQAMGSIIMREAQRQISQDQPIDLDQRLVDAISSDLIKQQLFSSYAINIASEDPEAARAFLDRYVDDPGLRASLEQLIEMARRNTRPGF